MDIQQNMAIEKYDPHILYNAINLTAELQYKIPMQRVYDILAIVNKTNIKNKNTDIKEIQPTDILNLLTTLGDTLEKSNISDEPCDTSALQSKIKELLRILGCNLSDQKLNQILKGEISIDDVLSKNAKTAWLIIFGKDEQGRIRPNKEIVDYMLISAQQIALQNIEMKINHNIIETRNQQFASQRKTAELLQKSDNIKTMFLSDKEKSKIQEQDPIELEKKRKNLRLYIAHMQGYDRDRDGDGSRGIDMSTGYIIDYDDIYISDKINGGSVIEDIDHDGIDIADIK